MIYTNKLLYFGEISLLIMFITCIFFNQLYNFYEYCIPRFDSPQINQPHKNNPRYKHYKTFIFYHYIY